VPYDRYAVGVHHVAFEAASREAVDRCWDWVLTEEVETESPPKEFPHYVAATTPRSSTTRTGSNWR